MKFRTVPLSVAVLVLTWSLLPRPAAAGIKCWTNKDGVRECGNTVPPEYAQGEHEEKNEQGLTINTTGKAKTMDEVVAEREAHAEEERRKAALAEQTRQQAAADRVLLDTFSSEDDLELARDGQITNVDAQIKVTESHVKKLDKSLDKMIGQAADLEKRGKPVPGDLARNIANVREQIADQHVFIEEKRQEQDSIRAKFEADIKRFRELRGTATSSAAPAAAE